MTHFIRILIISLALVILTNLVSAQEKDIVFEQITNESGRSLGFITGIVQDDMGFMWFSTRNGLYRYNGYSYKLFKSNKSDSSSLQYNDITSLYYDNNQNLWMRHYDELSVFKDEKHCTAFDSITNKHYDIEVEVVQDKKGNYWVAPTGKGIYKYEAKTLMPTLFQCPPRTFSDKSWRTIDSLILSTEIKAIIKNPGNNTDTTVSFAIESEGTFLISCSGELDKYGKYDYGSLSLNNDMLWQFNKENTMWSGGEEKNQFEAALVTLKPGNYQLSYKSDGSHCCGNWDGTSPNKISFCGISINQISQNDINQISSGLLNAYKSNTHIESEKIKDILIDNDGNFWALSAAGLEKYDYRKKRFVHFAINFEELLGTSIENEYLRIYQDKQGIFWIGSMYGLIRYDNIWGKFTLFQNTGKQKVLTSNVIYSIFEDNNNQIWIGTDRGINIYDKERNTITKIEANNHNRLYDNRIIQIYEDKGGNIWVATFEGLNRLIKTPFLYTKLNIKADNSFPAIYDEAANIWYGVGQKIKKYSRTYTTIEDFTIPDNLFNVNDFTGEADYSINDLIKDKDQHIWFATDNKANRLNGLSKKIDYSYTAGAIIVGNDSLKNSIKQIIEVNDKIMAFCPNGFYIINAQDLKKESFNPFNFSIDFIDEFDINYFKGAKKDKTGNIWIRTADGIYFYNIQLKNLEFLYEFPNQIKGGPLASGKMDFDKFGNLWFTTLPSINQISVESHEHKQWECSFDHEWGISNTIVTNNTIWSYGSNGLYSFNYESKKFNYYSLENGFIDNNINGLEEDNLGYVWLTTLKGLIKLDTSQQTSKNYFTSSDFTSHHFLGNSPNFKIKGGEKILFTTQGFVSFYPDSINKNKPKIVIDRFTLRGKDYPLDSLIHYKKTLQLKYNQNFLGFEFSALDYTNPALNKYKYKLEGLDDEWFYTDATDRRANYSGIQPGHYTLRITGSNNDQIWNEKGISLDIIISPPWYKTIAAYIIYALIIIIAVTLFIKIRERKLIEEKQILEQKVKERTAEIEAQKEELATQNEMIAEQHKNITDSIQYAQRIQAAILPPTEPLKEVFDDFFILYRPRDIVSGDYYWSTRHDEITIIVAADCTGHGVPGAFMSMLGIAFLNEIVNKEEITEPNLILDRLREQIMKQLHQTGEDGESKDGMDLSLYVINHKTSQLSFAGAYNPLYIIRDEEIIQLKADRMPIGYHIKKDVAFTKQDFHLQKGDCLYNSSDGYPDQFGGPDGRKFMTKNFKSLLLDIHKKTMNEQREILNTEFDKWRGETEQIDDVIVIGVRI